MDDSGKNKFSQLFQSKRIRYIGIGFFGFILFAIISFLAIGAIRNAQNKNIHLSLTDPIPVNKNDVLIKKNSPPYQPGVLSIRYKQGYAYQQLERENKKKELGEINKTLQEAGVIDQQREYENVKGALENYYLLTFKREANLVEAQKILQNSRYIDFAQPHYESSLFAIPNDPYYSQLWGLQKISMPQAWDTSTGSQSIVVAVIDSGIDMNQPEFAGRIVGGYDFIQNDAIPNDELGHGTHVAGTIGAIGNNALGVVGVNWDVKIMPFKLCNATGKCAEAIPAILQAANAGAQVVNMSLGTKAPAVQPCSQVPKLQEAINYAVSKGVVVVVAAGNDGRDASNVSPASCDNIITVGATDTVDKRSIWNSSESSNYGATVEIAAPGTNIYSTYIGGFQSESGTSMASPHVAGAAALLFAVNPGLSPQQVYDCITQNADTISTDRQIGGLRLNVANMISACQNLGSLSPTAPPTVSPSVSPSIGINPSGIPISPTPIISGVPVAPPPAAPIIIPQPGEQYYTCSYDPACNKNTKVIQLCPLICKPLSKTGN